MENLLKCKSCGEWSIAEEYEEHICLSRFDSILFDSDGTFSFDGKNWYRWLPDEYLQRDKKSRNPTETGQNPSSHKTKISLVISLAI